MMTLAREFFASPLERKMTIAMAHGGRAWRGYFPVDGELTSGRPDRKEGIYFGTDQAPTTHGFRPDCRCTAVTFIPRGQDSATLCSPI